jgi:hypothetical protein
MAISREIEERFGLTVATPKGSKPLTRPALERLLRDPNRAAAMSALRNAIDQAASKRDTLRGFLTELYRLGVEPHLKLARNSGVLQGVTFTLPDGSQIKGSDLGKKYSLANIASRHELRADRRPEGSVLLVSEVADREYQQLVRDGLPADFVARYGNRRTLYWQLPAGEEEAFADLIALRLPHRFLSATDRLPALAAKPDLASRSRQLQLLQELASLPEAVPPLPSVPRAEISTPDSGPTLAERAQRCQDLSSALLSADTRPPAVAASIRDDYHRTLEETVAHLRFGLPSPPSEHREILAELALAGRALDAAQDLPAFRAAAARFNALEAEAINLGALPQPASPAAAETSEISPAKFLASVGSGEPTAPLVQLAEAGRALDEGQDLPAHRASSRFDALEAEAIKVAAKPHPIGPAEPEIREISPAKFPVFGDSGEPAALAQPEAPQARGAAEDPPAHRASSVLNAPEAEAIERGIPPHPPGQAELEIREISPAKFPAFGASGEPALVPAILAPRESFVEREAVAAARYVTSGSEADFHAWARSQQQIRIAPATPRAGSPLQALAEDLLQAQDRNLTEPTADHEAALKGARTRYEQAARYAPAALESAPAAAEQVRVLRADLRELRPYLHDAEKRFLDVPHDPEARAGWTRARSIVADFENRLGVARSELKHQLARELRSRASTLAFYEEAYFQSPSRLTETLWRRAEKAHSTSALAYERARLEAEARPRTPASALGKSNESGRAERLSDAANTLGRLFEKQLLGQPARVDRAVERAALRLWARTDVGRRLLQAANPIQTIVRAAPGGGTALAVVDVTTDTVRRSLAIYAELRALKDRLRSSRGAPSLAAGDFSSPSLARAVVAAKIIETPPVPASLPQALKSSRSAEAQLHRAYRSFRRGLTSEDHLNRAAAGALTARAAVTEQLHSALGIPALKDFAAILGARGEGRPATAWLQTLHRAGLSVRAISSSLAEAAPAAIASGGAALALVAARRIVRWAAASLRTNVLEILRDQNDLRR